MASAIGEKVAYRKSSNFLRTWSEREGEVCDIEGVALSMARPAPRLVHGVEKQQREVAPRPSGPTKAVQRKSDDPYANLLGAAIDAAEAMGKFSRWLKTSPPPPPPPALPKQPLSSTPVMRPATKVPPFDLQDIPGAMRKLGMPMAAKLQERWFAGKANYSRSAIDLRNEINQDNLPYAPNMVDTTTVKMEWVLSFTRARKVFDELVQKGLHDLEALKVLRGKLAPYRHKFDLLCWETADQDLLKFHQKFQFQYQKVNGTWGQRISNFLERAIVAGGVPDDLTGALGSFNFYAAARYAYFEDKGRVAVVPEVSVYVRDPYDFLDDQYLGHWNSNHVAVVPAHQLASDLPSAPQWLDKPVVEGSLYYKDSVLYPVTNRHYRDWRDKHRQGGDFMIYTNRLNIKLAHPIRIFFQ